MYWGRNVWRDWKLRKTRCQLDVYLFVLIKHRNSIIHVQKKGHLQLKINPLKVIWTMKFDKFIVGILHNYLPPSSPQFHPTQKVGFAELMNDWTSAWWMWNHCHFHVISWRIRDHMVYMLQDMFFTTHDGLIYQAGSYPYILKPTIFLFIFSHDVTFQRLFDLKSAEQRPRQTF